MAQKYDLTDIGNALSRVMDNPMTKIIRSGSIGVLGVVNPVAGIVGGIGNDLLSEYNTFKLGHLLNGLASGFNLERRLNELYNYVNSSPEKAIIVANLFKQTVNAECPKVCVIYGLILANHLETLTEFTHEELIVCKALENATDYDLKNFKEIMELLFPAILSSTVGQIHIYVDMFFTSSISEGAWTAIGYANRVFQFPVGILVTAFLVPLFPIFARLVADNDLEGIKTYFNKGVGVLFFAAIPIIIGILTVGMDSVRLIFERGAFDTNATFMVTEALWFLSVSILPYVFRDSITRVYYSFNDSKTPFIVAFSSIVLKYLLNVIFISKLHMGIGGITLSTSLVTMFNACVLGALIYKKVRMDYKGLFTNLLKMGIAGGITLGICYFAAASFDKFVHIQKTIFEIIKIASIGGICLVVYTALNLIFKMEYAQELSSRLMRKLKR